MHPIDCARYGAAAANAGAADANDAETNIIDALANLMHYADSIGADFGAAVESAKVHHTAEVAAAEALKMPAAEEPACFYHGALYEH